MAKRPSGGGCIGRRVHDVLRSGFLSLALWAIVSATSAAQVGVAVAISPTYAQLVAGQTLQFSAKFSGSGDRRIVWQVNNADSGGADTGTI